MAATLQPPVIPRQLLDELGEPLHAFGPNMRFRRASFWVGSIVMTLGLAFFGVVAGCRVNGVPVDKSVEFLCLILSAGLLAAGGAAVFLPRLVPRNWLFVCPGGLIRTLGESWQSLEWDEIARFQDLSMTHRTVSIRQCRVVTHDGREWGWNADQVANFSRLAEVLLQEVENGKSPVRGDD